MTRLLAARAALSLLLASLGPLPAAAKEIRIINVAPQKKGKKAPSSPPEQGYEPVPAPTNGVVVEHTGAPTVIRAGEGPAYDPAPAPARKGVGLVAPPARIGNKGGFTFSASAEDEDVEDEAAVDDGDSEEEADARPAAPVRRAPPPPPARKPPAAAPARPSGAPSGLYLSRPSEDDEDDRPARGRPNEGRMLPSARSAAMGEADGDGPASAPSEPPSIRSSLPSGRPVQTPGGGIRVEEVDVDYPKDGFIKVGAQKGGRLPPAVAVPPPPSIPRYQPLLAPPPRREVYEEPPSVREPPRRVPEAETVPVREPPRREVPPPPARDLLEPEPAPAPVRAPPSREEDGERKPRRAVGAPVSPEPAPIENPFEKINRELRELEGKPAEPAVQPQTMLDLAPTRPVDAGPAPERPRALEPVVERPAALEPAAEPVLKPVLPGEPDPAFAVKSIEAPPPKAFVRDPSVKGLYVGGLIGAALARDPVSGFTPDLAFGARAAFNPAAFGPLTIDLSWLRATRDGGTPFIDVASRWHHVAARVLYLKEHRNGVVLGFGGGPLVTLNSTSYALSDGREAAPATGNVARVGADGTFVLGLRKRPIELRLELRAILRGGLRLDFLPTLGVGLAF